MAKKNDDSDRPYFHERTKTLILLAHTNENDTELLAVLLHEMLHRNTREAIELREWLRRALNREPPRPWYKKRRYQLVGAGLTTLLVGIGHKAGGEIWDAYWPEFKKLIGLTWSNASQVVTALL